MIYLIIASLIWAFSFGLVKGVLVGLDPFFVAWARLFLALPVFLPFLRLSSLNKPLIIRLLAIGAVEYGVLYTIYTKSYHFIEAYQVALFTIFTPLYIIIIDNLYKKTVNYFNLAMAALAVAGAAVIKYHGLELSNLLTGFLLVQGANICFAFGQMEYRRLRRVHTEINDKQVYALLFIGALIVATISATAAGSWNSFAALNLSNIPSLIFLGTISTGFAFFLWNVGAIRTPASVLAVMNNIKVPLAVLVSLTIFHEQTDLLRLSLGGGLMVLAVFLAETYSKKRTKKALST